MRRANPKPEQMEMPVQTFVTWGDAAKVLGLDPDGIQNEFMARLNLDSGKPAYELFTIDDVFAVAAATETVRFWCRLASGRSEVDPVARRVAEESDKAVLAMQQMVASLLAGKGMVDGRTDDDTG